VRDIYIGEGTIKEANAVKSLPTHFPQGTFIQNIFMRILQSWTSSASKGTLTGMSITRVLLHCGQNFSVTSCCWEKRVG